MKKQKDNLLMLKAAFQRGDERAFKRIFELYYEKLFAYVNSFANDSYVSEEVVQETFIKLWNHRSKFDIENTIVGFLYKTAYYTFIDDYRKKKREKAALDKLAYQKLMELVDEDDEFKNKRIEAITNGIEKLPNKCKEIFKMSKLQGYKYQEIADNLNISIKTVESQMGRAFTFIRKNSLDL